MSDYDDDNRLLALLAIVDAILSIAVLCRIIIKHYF